LIAMFEKTNIHPKYYLVIDSSSDLPYDVYRHGTSDARVPIYLQMPGDYLKELSEHSVIVDAITGRKRIDDKLYYPQDLIEQIPDKSLKKHIMAIVKEQKNRRI